MSVTGGQQQTALGLLRALQPHWRSDPNLPGRIQRLLGSRRDFGSRDRRLYRELIYTTLRYLPWVEPELTRDTQRAIALIAWLAADTRDTHRFRAETAAGWPEAGTLVERASHLGLEPDALLPDWLRVECPSAFEPAEREALLRRAPLWLRLQTDDDEAVASEFQERGWRWRVSPVLSTAWQLLDEADVTRTEAYARGRVEIQDLASQLLLEAVLGRKGYRILTALDACAGAGGKTLQLARLLGPHARIDAHDIRSDALAELRARASRANLPNVQVLADPPRTTGSAPYDLVLVDAPCSGSGTWRRAPHLKWTVTAETVATRSRTQRELLAKFAGHVRTGGLLIYATCSLARSENEGVISDFLRAHAGFHPVPLTQTFGFEAAEEGMTILPARHDTDGFFVAALQRAE